MSPSEVDEADEGDVSDFGISSAASSGRGAAPGPGPGPDPRYELAAALRRITTSIVGGDLTDEQIAAVLPAAVDIATTLEQGAGPDRRLRGQPDPAGRAQDFFPSSPVIGFANPVSPPILIEAVDGELRGTAWLDYPYEGPPTAVHGGVIAMIFDEIMAATLIISGTPAMTGTMTVRYLRPTPLRTELRLEARYVERDGRKIRSWGGIYAGDVLTAEAEGIFIQLPAQKFVEMVAENTGSTDAIEQIRADARRLGLAGSADRPDSV
jgi:acyl-coenzyme A thioesterase PaaI-like protein